MLHAWLKAFIHTCYAYFCSSPLLLTPFVFVRLPIRLPISQPYSCSRENISFSSVEIVPTVCFQSLVSLQLEMSIGQWSFSCLT